MNTPAKMLICLIGLLFLSTPMTSLALSYQEKKDLDALSVMERSFQRTPMQSRLFDGKQIPPGTNPTEVRLYLNQLSTTLKSASSSWRNVSNAGRATPKAQELAEQYNAYQAYVAGLTAAFKSYNASQAASSNAGQPRQAVVVRKVIGPSEEKQALQNTCKQFRQQLSPLDKTRIRWLVNLSNGQDLSLQNRNEIVDYRASAQAVHALCKKPEFNNIQAACQAMTSAGTAQEGGYCTAAANSEKLLQQAVINYAAFLAQQQGSAQDITVDTLKQQEGWIKYEGAVNWSTLTSGGKIPDVILKRLKPVFEEVGLQGAGNADVFAKMNASAGKLASVVKTLAPTWGIPGSTCQGSPCKVAENTLQAWYPKGKILKSHHKQTNWTIRQHAVTKIPIERYRSGWTLIKVPEDPFCQLRSWTVYETYQGGGKYQPLDNAQIGYVRWQSCG